MTAAHEAVLEVEAVIVCIQELYLISGEIRHPALDIRQKTVDEWKDQCVVLVVQKEINQVVESRINLVDIPYVQVIDVWQIQGSLKSRQTKIAIVYNNLLGEGQL